MRGRAVAGLVPITFARWWNKLRRKRLIVYWTTAGALAVGWYLALLFPPMTHQLLLGLSPPAWSPGIQLPTMRLVLFQLPVVCVVGLSVALLLRRWIVSASLGKATALSLTIPLAGAILFGILSPIRIAWAVQPQPHRSAWEFIGMVPIIALAAPFLMAIGAFYVAIPMGFLTQYLLNKVGRTGQAPSGRAFARLTFFVLVAAIPVNMWVSRTNGPRALLREMSWSYETTDRDKPGTRHVLLTFRECPEHAIGLFSLDVGNYLESLSTRNVPVEFQVWPRTGHMQHFRLVRIGALKKWKAVGGFYRVSPHDSPCGDDLPWAQ
jgi:hypothetical protein